MQSAPPVTPLILSFSQEAIFRTLRTSAQGLVVIALLGPNFERHRQRLTLDALMKWTENLHSRNFLLLSWSKKKLYHTCESTESFHSRKESTLL
jgi:hypothetical protein